MSGKSSAASGLAFALIGFALLSVNDAIAKSLAGEWPGSAASALRYVMGLVGMTVVVAAVHGRARFVLPRPGLQLARALGVGLASFAFFIGLQLMPLADATAIQFTSPMITALLSSLLLGERATRVVWISTAVAFAGVLVVLRPEVARIGWAAAWPLAAAFGMAVLMVSNRKSAGLAPVLVMQWLVALFATPLLVAAATLAHFSGWPGLHVPVPSWTVLAKVALIALSGTVAHLLIFMGTVRANAAVIAPMTYVQLLMAVAFGWIYFADTPDLPTLGGAALIVAAGLFLLRSQARPIVPEPAD